MKKTISLSAQFGISHKDMAMLLNVHISQWSMFEAGKRDLPAEAKLLLAEMLGHLEKQKQLKPHHEPALQPGEQQNYLHSQLQENKRKSIVLSRKLEAAKKKQLANHNAQQLTSFLAEQPQQKSALSSGHIKSLAARSATALRQNSAMALFRYEIQLELLKQQRPVLEGLLGECGEGNEGFGN